MKPTTIASLQKCKQEKKRFATITAYDYSFAKLFADEGLNVMLVGDSLGMTVQGHDSTLPVTVADIAYHTAAVRRGAPNCLLLADLLLQGLQLRAFGADGYLVGDIRCQHTEQQQYKKQPEKHSQHGFAFPPLAARIRHSVSPRTYSRLFAPVLLL